MRPLILSLILSLVSSVSSQTCTGHPVTDYGAFTPNASDSATIAQNNATINNAIVQAGNAGGGVICLPAGTFYIGPDPRKSDVAITINYNNITLCGAGHGILIKGTADCKAGRK